MFGTEDAIGVIDSGVGGVSVLRALRFVLPFENYIYFSDKKNAPYGLKPSEEIRRCVMDGAGILMSCGCKAIVVACNTATAVAIEALRERLDPVPVIGLEPALRPALKYASAEGRNVLVLATGVTLSQPRFKEMCSRLCAEYGARCLSEDNLRYGCINGVKNSVDAVNPEENAMNVYTVSAQRIVEYVEKGMGDSAELTEYLSDIFLPYRSVRFGAIVAGCTHFPFAERSIFSALGYTAKMFDGSFGAANRAKKLLYYKKILRSGSSDSGWISWISSESHGPASEYSRILRGLLRAK
ncbi:MAG: aspartate/glutamate racemase family protein [Clostridia bacterium]|nr:aspartate/glutamate racemase family protein [Clostridia bacterium]